MKKNKLFLLSAPLFFACANLSAQVTIDGKVDSSSVETTSGAFTANVILKPDSLPTGSGTFTGKTCFDLATGNDNVNLCGSVSGRLSQQTDFSNRTPQDGATGSYSGVQVYTFTPIKNVSRIRFAYMETSGISIERIEPASTAYAISDNINTACKVTVYYRKELNNELKGITRDDGNKLTLYAIYNSDATYSTPANDQMLELSISLQDCSCCGAYTNAAKTHWLNFMCHNLGANEDADPFVPAATIHGAKYGWGVATPALTQQEDQDQINDAGFSESEWSAKAGIPPEGSDSWNIKTANPCPAGWRVPTQAEWVNVIASNTLTYTGEWTGNRTDFTSGLKIGDALFLPAAGLRNYSGGELGNRGSFGYYWSSNAHSTSGNYLSFYNGYAYAGTYGYAKRSFGYSIRCVAE
jgi:uncharacterized protein (TIGR02145 family)